jgi:2-phospho-L-lactate/phosphoenolpyruvate guanylyltransferase
VASRQDLGVGWTVLVPVKRLDIAKTRLTRYAGPARADLALAFAVDAVSAAVAADGVATVLVVTDDPRVAADVATVGADVVADLPGAGLNPALSHGVQVAHDRYGLAPVAALSADLPALRPDDLTAALAAAADLPRSFVADVDGTGTTLLTAWEGADLGPEFGHRSRARHAASGAVELVAPLVSLRRDVDTEVDLYDAVRLGVGPRTRAVLARLATG